MELKVNLITDNYMSSIINTFRRQRYAFVQYMKNKPKTQEQLKEIADKKANKSIKSEHNKMSYLRKYALDYYYNHKDTLNVHNICPECNGKYTNKNKLQHSQSKKHLKALKDKAL